MNYSKLKRTGTFFKTIPWKRVGIAAAIIIPVGLIIAQFIYPIGNTKLFSAYETVDLSNVSAQEAKSRIEQAYGDKKLNIFFGQSKTPYRSPALSTLGVSVVSDEIVDSLTYTWWQRLIPSSLWWAHLLPSNTEVTVSVDHDVVEVYATKELGTSCEVAPKSATLQAKGDAVEVVAAEDGGTCRLSDVIDLITDSKISLSEPADVRVAMSQISPKISSSDATKVRDEIESHLGQAVQLTYGDKTFTIESKNVRSWLTFDNTTEKLAVSIDQEKAKDTLTSLLKKAVYKAASTITITTRDFQEVSRSGGGDGQDLNIAKTADNIAAYLTGASDSLAVATSVVPAEKKYIRSYSATDTGISARIQHFAEENAGVYGVSLVELSGQRRRAGYNDTRKFTTASTYKLYVAYAVLRRIENGSFSWTQQINGGRDLAKCFDDMIVLSDNPCAEAFVQKIGYTPMHNEVRALGLNSTSFIDAESYKTSAGDLSTFMASLESGQLPISSDSRSRLIGALKRNVYRQGIPSGASGTVADKVGFLDGLLHDAAIIYAPSGTYVLTVLTDGSSWANIAALTREIEKIRAN